MPEMQAAMLSDSMVPPIHTWMGFRSFRSDMGDQGRRKPAIPTAHWLDKCMDIHRYSEHKGLRINAMKEKNHSQLIALTNKVIMFLHLKSYLYGEESCSGESDPAV